jgi:hypothetical protein
MHPRQLNDNRTEFFNLLLALSFSVYSYDISVAEHNIINLMARLLRVLWCFFFLFFFLIWCAFWRFWLHLFQNEERFLFIYCYYSIGFSIHIFSVYNNFDDRFTKWFIHFRLFRPMGESTTICGGCPFLVTSPGAVIRGTGVCEWPLQWLFFFSGCHCWW